LRRRLRRIALLTAVAIAASGCGEMNGAGSSRKALEKPATPPAKLKGAHAKKHRKILEQIESADPRDRR
jgi:hypothetical protein